MKVKKSSSKILVLSLVFSLILTTCMGMNSGFVQAKEKKSGITVTNKKSEGFLVIRVKKKVQLKLKSDGKKVATKKIKKKFKFKSSKKKILTVNKNGQIYAKKVGTAKVYVTQKGKSKKKKYTLKVKVISESANIVTTQSPLVSSDVTTKPTETATVKPTETEAVKPTETEATKPTATAPVKPTETATATAPVKPTETATTPVKPTETATAPVKPTETATVKPTAPATPDIPQREDKAGKITLDEANAWEKLLETITFGLYKAPNTEVSIEAYLESADIYYYIDKSGAEEVLAESVLKSNEINWVRYTVPVILQNEKNVVYAKIVDQKTEFDYYLCSNGICIGAAEAPTPEVTAKAVAVELSEDTEYAKGCINEQAGVTYKNGEAEFVGLTEYSGGGVMWYASKDKKALDLSNYEKIIFNVSADTPNTKVVLAAVHNKVPQFHNAETTPTYPTIEKANTPTELVMDLSGVQKPKDFYAVLFKYNTHTENGNFEGGPVRFKVHSIKLIEKAGVTPTPTESAPVKPTESAPVKPTESAPATPTESAPATPTPEPQLVSTEDCSGMDHGGYAGPVGDKPFTGMCLYANGDYCKTSYTFEGTNKKYRMVVKGASNCANAAGVSVYIGDKKIGSVSFTGTELTSQSFDFKMTDVTGNQEIKFLLENDNGQSDTYINSYELYYIGDIPPLPAAPQPAAQGAAYTGNYRNLFKELGHSDAEINEKVNTAWQKLFYGTEEERIYYPVGDDEAYIYTADSNDVRSEGMSYGMMICVQMDKQEEFNRLWKWAKTHMQHTSGEHKGYFAWQMNKDGSIKDRSPATDGEEYFATALLFASARWNDGEGIYNYNKEAQEILKTMLHQADDKQGWNMFDAENKMPVFVPYGNSANHTDPSYHLPAFYEIWAIEAEQDKEFWSAAAEASRQHFKDATNGTTGLGPDYSEFTGAPKNDGNHGDFRYDAWRIAGNIACDYAWWAKDSWATTHANRIQSFFYDKGVESYGNLWSLDGTNNYSPDHSPGLVAMNATAGLAASDQKAWAFVEDLWNISPTKGEYRYYDGCLYMMGLLHCSGKFRAYFSGGTPVAVVNGKISETSAEFDLKEGNQQNVTTELILGGERTLEQIKCGDAVLAKGSDYTVEGTTVTISKGYLATKEVGVTKLTFVFDKGKNATMSITVKDSDQPDVPIVSGPFEKIQATAYDSSNNVTVENGIVKFNSTDSYIAFNLDFGSETAKKVSAYVKEPNNSGQLFVSIGSLGQNKRTVWNLGNGSWTEASENLNPTVTGSTTIYIQTNKPGVEIEWLQFTK